MTDAHPSPIKGEIEEVTEVWAHFDARSPNKLVQIGTIKQPWHKAPDWERCLLVRGSALSQRCGRDEASAMAFGRALHLLDKHARKYPEVLAFLLQYKFKRHCRFLVSDDKERGSAAGAAPFDQGAPTPSPTGTELALEQAKRHIETLTRFWMDNAEWTQAANAARAFTSGIPEQVASDAARDGTTR